MSEREKEILTRLAVSVPKLETDKQNYILGIAEGMALAKEEKENDKKHAKAFCFRVFFPSITDYFSFL